MSESSAGEQPNKITPRNSFAMRDPNACGFETEQHTGDVGEETGKMDDASEPMRDCCSPTGDVRTFHLTVAYEGTLFSGWQVQPERRTVQGELEKVVAKFAGHDLRILGSGRTDAGVHAIGQVARCVLRAWKADEIALLRAINSKLPDDLIVKDIRETHNRFHPIADAVAKQYRYRLQIGGHRDPFSCRTWHRIREPIDTELLQSAASRLIGQHDFAAFQAAGAQRATTIRTITQSQWRCERDNTTGGSRWVYEVEGNGFLYNMVRNLVGTMLEVARGRRPLEWIADVIASKDRKTAGPTAPPTGLFLYRVDYPDSIFLQSR